MVRLLQRQLQLTREHVADAVTHVKSVRTHLASSAKAHTTEQHYLLVSSMNHASTHYRSDLAYASQTHIKACGSCSLANCISQRWLQHAWLLLHCSAAQYTVTACSL
jgi:hypothetical protein